MKCPRCTRDLAGVDSGGILVDICDGGCGGIWFDFKELRKVDEPHESAGESLLAVTRDPRAVVEEQRELACPRCMGQLLLRHFHSIQHRVEIDECPRCGGFWLDAGELGEIRGMFDTDEERVQAAERFFEDTFGCELEGLLQGKEARAALIGRINRVLGFVCPDDYQSARKSRLPI